MKTEGQRNTMRELKQSCGQFSSMVPGTTLLYTAALSLHLPVSGVRELVGGCAVPASVDVGGRRPA